MADTLWDAITRKATDFIEGGQDRTAALQQLGRDLEYYVPPELRNKIGLLAKGLEFTDAGDMPAAADASRELWNNPSVGSAANYAAAGLGLALPFVSSRMMQEGVDVAGDAISSLTDDAKSIWARLNQPGPVPTMNAIFPSKASIDEVFDFVKENKPIYHSGPASMAEDMQKWGVEPSYGPWVKEIAAGAVDDVDEFLDQVPPAAWWSDQPDWIKMKVARAAKKPVSDVTVDDIRKHGHLAIASADDYSDVAFRIGDEGLENGEYSFVEDLAGNRMRLYETPLYSEGNYPFGIERNEIVTRDAIEPAYSLTGDDLVNFMQRQGLLSTNASTLPTPRNVDEPTGILAYHGSPYDFERFDFSKMGTGEGAQAYGRGGYFASEADVARGFRRRQENATISGKPVYKVYDEISSRADRLSPKAAEAEYNKMAVLEDLMNDGDILGVRERASGGAYDPAAMDWFEKEIAPKFKGSGSLYEVNIKADPAEFLDWEKPLSEQPKKVLDALDPFIQERLDVLEAAGQRSRQIAAEKGLPDFTPKTREELFSRLRGGDIAASGRTGQSSFSEEALQQAGVPGIKYLDPSARSTNYVVFDENLINIVRKYGIAGAAAMLGMSQADLAQAMQAQQPQQPQGLLGGPQ